MTKEELIAKWEKELADVIIDINAARVENNNVDSCYFAGRKSQLEECLIQLKLLK